MKKEDKSLSTLRTYLLLTIIVVSLVSFLAILRAYFVANQNTSTVIETSAVKYNDPLVLSKLPTFINAESNNYLPTSNYELEDNQNLWLSLKTSEYNYVGFLSKDLKLNLLQVLPKNSSNIKVYKDGKMFFILEAQNGNGPSLIFKQDNNGVSILNLAPNQFFTGYYYSASEKLFYISSGNSSGVYSLIALKQDGTKSTLLELSSEFAVISANSENAIIKQSGECYTLNYFAKKLSEIECSKVYLNSQNVNLITSSSQISLNINGNIKNIYTASNSEVLRGATYFNSNIYFVVYKFVDNIQIPFKIIRSDTNGNLTEISTDLPNGDILNLLDFNGLIAVNKYFGVKRILRFNQEAPSSYPQNPWVEVNLLPQEIYELELLGADYQIY